MSTEILFGGKKKNNWTKYMRAYNQEHGTDYQSIYEMLTTLHKECQTAQEMAAIFDVEPRTMRQAMRRHGVKLRQMERGVKVHTDINQARYAPLNVKIKFDFESYIEDGARGRVCDYCNIPRHHPDHFNTVCRECEIRNAYSDSLSVISALPGFP